MSSTFIKRLRELSYEDTFGVRLGIGALFVVAFAFFLHFREVVVDLFEVNSRAPRYVVAEVNFAFPDPDATMILRQEALRDIGRIYKIPETEITHAHHQVKTELHQHPKTWRSESHATYDEMEATLDMATQLLTSARITDPRTLKKAENLQLNSAEYFYLSTSHEGQLPADLWDKIESKLQQEHLSQHSIDFIIRQFKQQKWTLASDIDAQKMLREEIESGVPEKYTQVTAGSRILDQGEKVTPKHIAMLKAMKSELNRSRNLWTFQTILGSLVFSLIITLCAALYLYHRHKRVFASIRELSVYITIVLVTLVLAKGSEWLLVNTTTQWSDFIRYPIIVPFAAILICLLLDEELALFTSAYLTVILATTLAVDHTSFLFINLITGTIATLSSAHLKKRKEVFVVSVKLWLAAAIIVLAFNLTNGTLFTYLTLVDLIALVLNLFIVTLLIIGFTPIFESSFNLMTDMTLMEFMDPTNILLKRLSIEAPGTYQHSISLGFIAEYVANAIGANGLFCRVTTLYHDIGKLNTPHYYTENQLIMGGNQFDIHQLLTPVESAYIIKAHVQDGADLARQYNLPQSFIDIIFQHHGTTLIKYFYAKRLAELGGNPNDVDESAFRYPGPKPQTKESAIIMLADSMEAASRTLEDNSEETIRAMVDRVANDKISDNQFDECPLTFHELYLIKNKFVEIIKATHHLRIKYPEPPKK